MSFKFQKYFRITRETFMNIRRALPVVSNQDTFGTTHGGLLFFRNWFKNKVPHHLATQM